MLIQKKNNQYYAEYIEQAVFNNYMPKDIVIDYNFSEIEINEMNTDAFIIFQNFFSEYKNIQYCGRKTRTECADFICDGKNIELKYVAQGNGTYFNTTIEYCHKQLGFTSFQDYLKNSPQLKLLAKYFGNKVYENISPVSKEESSTFRKEYEKIYKKQLVPMDKMLRKQYVKDFYEYVVKNNLVPQLYLDMINKYSKKDKPDSIIIFNHQTKKSFKLVNFDNNENFTTYISGDFSIIINNIKITFAWQNGTGLNNPTLRIFLV